MSNPSYHFPAAQQHRRAYPHLGRPTAGTDRAMYAHSRTRTTSSNVFPAQMQIQSQYPQPASNTMLSTSGVGPDAGGTTFASRRTPSTTTFSTTASSGNAVRQSMSSNFTTSTSSDHLRRSTSSRSGGGGSQPSSYVALMRKQKATVWCDRSQHEDPRLLAVQKLAKIRAANEVMGGSVSTAGRSYAPSGSIVGSNKVTAKIRYHGKPGLVGYTPAENFSVGVGGVPMRLSASEVEGEDSEDDDANSARQAGLYHHRSGSGRSSLGSGRRGLTYGRQSGQVVNGRWSSGTTPPSEPHRVDSLTDLAEAAETPLASAAHHSKDYFPSSDARSGHSGGSGSSGERRDGLPDLDDGSAAARLASRSLLARTNLVAREKSVRNPEELRRRGSVDERTMTMSLGAGRLFVANPDVDSD